MRKNTEKITALLYDIKSTYIFLTIITIIFFSVLLQHFDCRNHIRVIQSMGDGSRLYVCGTNAHNPKDWVINVSNYQFILVWYNFFFFEKSIIITFCVLVTFYRISFIIMLWLRNLSVLLECFTYILLFYRLLFSFTIIILYSGFYFCNIDVNF